MDKTQIGLAGEYYALAQLTQHGLVATLTLSNTKGVDILLTNEDLNELYKLEVKTTDQRPRNQKLFGDERFYVWTMSQKHEDVVDARLFYCFVALRSPELLPKFFIVPSKDVAKYVRWQHDYWLSTRKRAVKSTSMRKFRIPISDPEGYEGNWAVFGV